MQTILGAGGAIGNELAKSLTQYTENIRLVGRNPKKVNDSDELYPADVMQKDQLQNAIKGSEVVYVTVGFPYNTKIWQSYWPTFIQNTIDICKAEGCKLVFFDNVYMYADNVQHHMTEEATQNPSSKKGKVRKQIADMIMSEVEKGELNALIARSADFYGPNIERNCFMIQGVFDPLSQGKPANWLGALDKQHNFTYTPDAGRATALLGNTESAYNQVWHLPTAGGMTGQEWVNNIAGALGTKPKVRVAGKTMLSIIGLFQPALKESKEMLFAWDRDYVFNSDKFQKAFDFKPTTTQDAINTIAKGYKNR